MIGILEWNISSLGGRQRTMLAFADYLKSHGHNVKVYTSFHDLRSDYGPHNFLEWTSCTKLNNEDMYLMSLSRAMRSKDVPAEWHNLDALIIPYGGYGYLKDYLPHTKVIAWVINAQQGYYPVDEIWTNSNTILGHLNASDTWGPALNKKVVIPPHSYSMFRAAARPRSERKYDVVTCGHFLHDKGLVEFDDFCRRKDLKGVIIGARCKSTGPESIAVMDGIKHCPYVTNIRSSEVAEILGDSKVFLSMSRRESAPLTLYEALNAGCIPIFRDTGAVREQMGYLHSGCVYDTDEHGELLVLASLIQGMPNIPALQERGMVFDRANIGHMTLEALNV